MSPSECFVSMTQKFCYSSIVRRMERSSVVYLITGVNLIKIGTTSNLEERIKTLQASSPVQLDVLASGSGGIQVERRLHRQHAEYRHHGEWFDIPEHLVPQLVAVVKSGTAERCRICSKRFKPTYGLRSFCSSACRGASRSHYARPVKRTRRGVGPRLKLPASVTAGIPDLPPSTVTTQKPAPFDYGSAAKSATV